MTWRVFFLFVPPGIMTQTLEEEIWKELCEKGSRLLRLSARWVVSALVVFLFMGRLIQHFPQLWVTVVWLLLWVVKGVMDVLEDVRGARARGGELLWSVTALLGCATGLIAPMGHPSMLICVGVLLAASAFAGLIDRPVWKVAGVICAVGVCVGVARFWRLLLVGRDGQLLIAGAALFAVLEALQDRFFSDFRGVFLVELKVVPTVAVAALAVFVSNGEFVLGPATLAFVLCSPHFVVYDLAKVCLCFSLLQGKQKASGGPAALSSRMREALLHTMVRVATGRTSATVRDPELAVKILNSNEDKVTRERERKTAKESW
jgi:hypothetical protein